MISPRERPSFNAVILEFLDSVPKPDRASVTAWMRRYPEYAAEIAEFSAAWVLSEVLPDAHLPRPTAEVLTKQGMTILERALYQDPPEEKGGTQPIEDLLEEAKRRGLTVQRLAINADVEITAAVRAHLDGAGYQLAALLPALRGHPDRVVITGDASEMAPLLPEGLPPCGGPHPVATFVVHITVAVSALARACAASLVRKVLSAKAAAGPRDTVIVVLLANGETGVMTAELELVSSAPSTPADPVCNAPGGRA